MQNSKTCTYGGRGELAPILATRARAREQHGPPVPAPYTKPPLLWSLRVEPALAPKETGGLHDGRRVTVGQEPIVYRSRSEGCERQGELTQRGTSI